MWCYCYYLLPYYLRNNTSNYNIVLISVTFTCEKMVGKTSAWICSLKKTSIAKICWTIPTYWFPSAQETIGCYSILPTTRSHCSNCVINYLLKVFLLLFFSHLSGCRWKFTIPLQRVTRHTRVWSTVSTHMLGKRCIVGTTHKSLTCCSLCVIFPLSSQHRPLDRRTVVLLSSTTP